MLKCQIFVEVPGFQVTSSRFQVLGCRVAKLQSYLVFLAANIGGHYSPAQCVADYRKLVKIAGAIVSIASKCLNIRFNLQD